MRARPSRRANDGSNRFRTGDARLGRHFAGRRPIVDSTAVIASALRARRGNCAAASGSSPHPQGEVNPVMRALRDHGIEVTALHTHMLEEQPRLFFMHFWANDDAVTLAKGLRAALDLTKAKKG